MIFADVCTVSLCASIKSFKCRGLRWPLKCPLTDHRCRLSSTPREAVLRSLSIHPKLRRIVFLVPFVATVILCTLSSANAATLSEHTGLSGADSGGYYGLGFTVSGTGSFPEIGRACWRD